MSCQRSLPTRSSNSCKFMRSNYANRVIVVMSLRLVSVRECIVLSPFAGYPQSTRSFTRRTMSDTQPPSGPVHVPSSAARPPGDDSAFLHMTADQQRRTHDSMVPPDHTVMLTVDATEAHPTMTMKGPDRLLTATEAVRDQDGPTRPDRRVARPRACRAPSVRPGLRRAPCVLFLEYGPCLSPHDHDTGTPRRPSPQTSVWLG